MHVHYKFGLYLIFLLTVMSSHHQHGRSIAASLAINERRIGSLMSPNTNDYNDNDSDYDNYNESDNNERETDDSGAIFIDKEQSSSSTSSYPITTTKSFTEKAQETLRPLITTTATTMKSFLNLFDLPQRSNHVVEPQCPEPCHCMDDVQVVNCSGKGLKEVTSINIPLTANIIDLSHNRIEHIHPKDFSNRSKLMKLYLNNNQLTEVTKQDFERLPRLQVLNLANNRLTDLNTDTFQGAPALKSLDISSNAIRLQSNRTLINQPSLLELYCRNCSWSTVYKSTFQGIPSLNTLQIDQNDLKRKIDTQPFSQLNNLYKLRLPDLEQSYVEDLCNLLKSIDDIALDTFNISCYELVLGTSYNDSITLLKSINKNQSEETSQGGNISSLQSSAATDYKSNISDTSFINRQASDPTNLSSSAMDSLAPVAAGIRSVLEQNITDAIINGLNALNGTEDIVKDNEKNDGDFGNANDAAKDGQSYQMPIPPELINQLLIALMVVSLIALIIGIICRKDVGGIKTRCCRSRPKNTATMANGPTSELAHEEIPLNKMA